MRQMGYLPSFGVLAIFERKFKVAGIVAIFIDPVKKIFPHVHREEAAHQKLSIKGDL